MLSMYMYMPLSTRRAAYKHACTQHQSARQSFSAESRALCCTLPGCTAANASVPSPGRCAAHCLGALRLSAGQTSQADHPRPQVGWNYYKLKQVIVLFIRPPDKASVPSPGRCVAHCLGALRPTLQCLVPDAVRHTAWVHCSGLVAYVRCRPSTVPGHYSARQRFSA
jgi:hypothetical protein